MKIIGFAGTIILEPCYRQLLRIMPILHFY